MSFSRDEACTTGYLTFKGGEPIDACDAPNRQLWTSLGESNVQQRTSADNDVAPGLSKYVC